MLEVKDLKIQRGNKVIFDQLSLSIDPKEVTAIVGPSGCGKTSFFLALLGIVDPKKGEIVYSGNHLFKNKNIVPTQKRNFGVVFQDLALFPHMTVKENVLYGLDKSEKDRAQKMLDIFALTGHENKLPHELSGGERQRLALARSIAPDPEYLLLDETFSSLDPSLRSKLRKEVRAILKELNQGCMLISHDMEEVLEFSDKVIVFNADGEVSKIGKPQEI